MKPLHAKWQTFIHLLRAAYHNKKQAEVSDDWQLDVMRAVRHIGPLNAQGDPFVFMNRVAWRFASVACTIVLLLSVYVAYAGFSPETGVVNQLLDNPVGFMLLQVIGGY